MSDLSTIVAGPNRGTPPARLTPVNFDAAAVAAYWHSSAARLMRSSEVFMRSMAEVARLELQLGQHLMQHGLAELKTPAPGRETQQLARAQLGHATQEFEGLIASLRKIADASRCAYKDATLALFDAASPAAHPSHPAELHAGEQVINVAPVPTAAAPGMARTAE